MSYAEMALSNNCLESLFKRIGPELFVSGIHSQYGEALVFSALTRVLENHVLLFSACAKIFNMDNAYLVTFLTCQEHEDVLSGVLDIGWLYRHSNCLIVECAAVFSIGDQVTIGDVKRATLEMSMEDIDKVLPSLDFFLRPTEENIQVTFNLNDYVWVRLTEHARHVLEENLLDSRLPENMEELVRSKWVPDEKGYVKFQMWELCREFGQHMYNGCKQLFVDNTIKLSVEDLQ